MQKTGRLALYDLQGDAVDRLTILMEHYHDRPMDSAAASLIVAAERLGIRRLHTLDSDCSLDRLATGSPPLEASRTPQVAAPPRACCAAPRPSASPAHRRAPPRGGSPAPLQRKPGAHSRASRVSGSWTDHRWSWWAQARHTPPLEHVRHAGGPAAGSDVRDEDLIREGGDDLVAAERRVPGDALGRIDEGGEEEL